MLEKRKEKMTPRSSVSSFPHLVLLHIKPYQRRAYVCIFLCCFFFACFYFCGDSFNHHEKIVLEEYLFKMLFRIQQLKKNNLERSCEKRLGMPLFCCAGTKKKPICEFSRRERGKQKRYEESLSGR